MKLSHFYKRPPGHAKGKVGCSICGERSGLHPSKHEADFDAQLDRAGLLTGMVPEFAFAATLGRRWRFDRAWPGLYVAVELDGGTFMARGGHTTQQDRDRDNCAQLLGWLVLRFDARQIKLGLALRQTSVALAIRLAPASERASFRQMIRPDLFPLPSVVKAALAASPGRRRPTASVEHRGRSTAVADGAPAPTEAPPTKLPPG